MDQVLSGLVSTLTEVVDLARLPDTVLRALQRSTPMAEAGWLALTDAASGRLRLAATLGGDLALMRNVELQPSEALLGGEVTGAPGWYESQELIRVALSRLAPETRAALEQAWPPLSSLHSLLVVPLSLGARLVGVLWLAPVGQPSDSWVTEASFWQPVGALIGLALDHAQREAQGASPTPQPPTDQTRSEALAILSHELRTPLAAIKGYATALLLDEVEWTPEEQHEFLTLIDRECDTVQAMISEVLDSALIDAGHLGIELEPVRLPHLSREVADEIQRQTTSHRLVVDFPADFPLLMADARRLRQVLRNLLDNAVKYSPDGGLIVMRGEVRPGDVVVSIADQGVGIAPEDLIPLFDKYFRVQRTSGEHVPGTGLGLPITRAIVEAHGGRIWAESKLGQGTTFHFSLPRGETTLAEGPEQ
jgi:signal transduction histidine kinase